MDDMYTRSEALFGDAGMERLKAARVALFGVGGVGGYAAEALVRGGVGELLLVDGDVVSPSNINRQLVATTDTIGQYKADVMRTRALAINPYIKVKAKCAYFLPETADEYDFSRFDYVLDAVDMVTAKIEIIVRARQAGARAISAMGAGNKLDPTRFEVADIYATSVCPLARAMRRELRARGVDSLKVVYSREEPRLRAVPPASASFVPGVAGLIMAGEALKDIAFSGAGAEG